MQIRTSSERSDRTYGSVRVTRDLHECGFGCGHNRLARFCLWRALRHGISAVACRPIRVRGSKLDCTEPAGSHVRGYGAEPAPGGRLHVYLDRRGLGHSTWQLNVAKFLGSQLGGLRCRLRSHALGPSLRRRCETEIHGAVCPSHDTPVRGSRRTNSLASAVRGCRTYSPPKEAKARKRTPSDVRYSVQHSSGCASGVRFAICRRSMLISVYRS